MSLRKFAWGLVAALVALPALSADIDGKWNATADTPQGPINLVFDFKAEGEKLAGTLSADILPQTPISDGVVKGNDITFKLSIQIGPDMPALVINYKGSVKGDDLTLDSVMDMGQGPMESRMMAKRAK